MLSLNSVPFCNFQKTKPHHSCTPLSKSSLFYGCSNLRYNNRNYNSFLLRCLYHYHRRHLQEPFFLIPNSLSPNTPLLLFFSPSIKLGVFEKMSNIDAMLKLKQICFSFFIATLILGSSVEAKVLEHSHQCNHNHGHGHGHGHGHVHHHDHHHHDHGVNEVKQRKLPEELAEEEDLQLYGFGSHDDHDHGHHHHHHHQHGHEAMELTGLGLWVEAMGCSLLVSLASLICLIILPVIFLHGKPSKAVVDSLALFGAGAMLGDAFLHQLPHAFGGGHTHSHDHHVEPDHLHDHSGQSHAHSLEDLSVGLSILAGIVLFLIVEKLVRYVEDSSGRASHGHHHHHHAHIKKLKDDNDANDNLQELSKKKSGGLSEKEVGGAVVDKVSADSPSGGKPIDGAILRKRNSGSSAAEDKKSLDAANSPTSSGSDGEEQATSRSSLVFGYLNLFSDGVHNFTDGMALGSAFLLYGSVGGWSRTLFLLAHELPQEIGDFGILVRSGFSASKALFFNFLSALVALAGTALALTLGQDTGHSSLIEGFTAGGFIYISVAGVLAEMNNGGKTTLVNTVIQLISLLSGMAVALCISLIE